MIHHCTHDLEEFHKHNTEQKKSDTKEPGLYEFIYTEYKTDQLRQDWRRGGGWMGGQDGA